jgi:hypothetical protein
LPIGNSQIPIPGRSTAHSVRRGGLVVLVSPWYRPAMDGFELHFTVHKLWEAADRAGLLASLRDRCVGIAGKIVCDAALMDALPKTKVIAHVGVGYQGIDVAAATAPGHQGIEYPACAQRRCRRLHRRLRFKISASRQGAGLRAIAVGGRRQ